MSAEIIRRPRVLVVQRRLTHYRVPFFESLRDAMSQQGLDLLLAHGVGMADEMGKNDQGDLPWSNLLPTRYLAGGRLCWQPFGHLLQDVDAVVIAAENKLIYNLWVQWARRDVRVILWGHGGNLQGDRRSLRERFKRWVALKADWWFGYTAYSRPLILASGFPPDRMTMLNNAVDTRQMQAQRLKATPERQRAMQHRLQLDGGPVGIFVGSLYAEKRVDFLLQAADAVHLQRADFKLVVVGDGPLRGRVEEFCAQHPWARYAGVLKGQDKIDAMGLAQVMLNPGLVGLGILDSFVCGVPMVTTDCGLHSPEIAYLNSGGNGLMTPDRLDDYVQAVLGLLADERGRQQLVAGCLASGHEYTVQNMARHFAQGVVSCLARPTWRWRNAS